MMRGMENVKLVHMFALSFTVISNFFQIAYCTMREKQTLLH